MAEETNSATVAVPPRGGLAGFFPSEAKSISNEMVLLTWIAFLIAAILLHRLAWKPILRALDKREQDIRASLADAERARQEAAASAEKSRQTVAEAMERARALTEAARLSAERAATRLEQEARDQSRRMVEDAGQEIIAAQRRAVEDLRREAALLAVNLSEKMLGEHLTPEQRRAYETRAAGNLPS